MKLYSGTIVRNAIKHRSSIMRTLNIHFITSKSDDKIWKIKTNTIRKLEKWNTVGIGLRILYLSGRYFLQLNKLLYSPNAEIWSVELSDYNDTLVDPVDV